ncbi:MAG: S8 family serine peptidase [Planctomycetota bacterium]
MQNKSSSEKVEASPDRPNSLFETCEERLVLSAQALIDVVAEIGQVADSATAIEPQMAEAHGASGLDSVIEQYGLTGEGQTVAVIDSGIAWDHVALGQGYGPGYRVVGGWDFAENDDQPYDDGPAGFHGTHVSGVIGSDDPSNPGVASEVDLVSLRVFDNSGQGQLDWVENALRWVHDNQDSFANPITTVNISVGALDGGQALSTLEDELQQLYRDGIVVTASAGNFFQDSQATGLTYPASSPHVLPVASVDSSGQLSDFSQRDSRVLAAPGEYINSSVPDHVLGRDGRIDDFTASSGTSMASPYVAGASVLVRQAMEMVGASQIDTESIWEHLRETADSVYDSITGQSYDRLNLEEAISSLIPVDSVASSTGSAQNIDFSTIQSDGELNTWINNLQDQDVYQFTASESGKLQLDAESHWNDSLSWTLSSGGRQLASSGLDPANAELIAGQQYELNVFAQDKIGPGSIHFDFEADASSSVPNPLNPSNPPQTNGSVVPLGQVDFQTNSLTAGSGYSAIAANDGVFSLVWENPDSASGQIIASHAGSQASAQNWNDGSIRIDLSVQAGEEVRFQLPGHASDSGQLTIANLVRQSGSTLQVGGTGDQDSYAIDLRDGKLQLAVGGVDYAFSSGEIRNLHLDAGGSGDQISIQGSEKIESVELRPGETLIENQQIRVQLDAIEDVHFSGGGNADRIYMYDSNTDDTLRAYPGRAELSGVGYSFVVDDVSRIFVHATGTGEDLAYVYDSEGDDQLSARPQFTSMKGDGYFNYVRGFERVYAYANSGGQDTAALYDSEGADRFSAAGDNVLISGPGFSSHVRGFEEVTAHAHAGGEDRATLYGTEKAGDWFQAADYVSFQEGAATREARGFETVETFENMRPISIQTQTADLHSAQEFSTKQDDSSAALTAETGAATQPNPTPSSPVSVGSGETFVSELGIYAQTLSVSEIMEDRLQLQEEDLLEDESQEQELLHEVFSQYGRS